MSLGVAFIAGLLAFFSPCILPVIPLYILYIAGISLDELKRENNLFQILTNTIFFIIGFTIVFVLLGATATLIGKFLQINIALLEKFAGAIIIFFGLYLFGLFKIGFLDIERKLEYRRKQISIFSSLIFGMTFALAWTPCTGPILASMLLLASIKKTVVSGMLLLGFFSLGVGLPFLICGILINQLLWLFKSAERFISVTSKISATFLVVLGIILVTGQFGRLTTVFNLLR